MTDIELSERVRTLAAEGGFAEAWAYLRPALRLGGDYGLFRRAVRLLATAAGRGWTPGYRRAARLALVSTFETAELGELLPAAGAIHGLRVEMHVPPFGQVEQCLLEPAGLAAFAPTHVLLAPCTQDLGLSDLVEKPEAVVDAVVARWTGAWRLVAELGARPVQLLFAVPDSDVLGNLASTMPRSRTTVVREINRRLAAAASRSHVLVVDVDRIASDLGKRTWFDHRIWHATRQPAGYEGLAATAREIGAVLAADAGLGCKCLVLDLDGSLWGGVVGELGWDGVEIGPGSARGEAFRAFQEFLASLRELGVMLAVSSKNDGAAAREPFERNPHMRLRLGDFAAFVADWRPKSEQVRDIVDALGVSPEDVVLLDDNPAECLEVRQRLPDVGTVVLAGPIADFPRLVASSVLLEPVSRTEEDTGRAASYTARGQAERLRGAAASLPEFWHSLEMTARVRPVTERTVERAAQLSQKTNQFNLTLRRRSPAEIDALRRSADWTCLTIGLADRFADHGIVGLCLAGPVSGGELPIDTLVLSCRVIGRTAEHHLLAALSRQAADAGIRRLRGHYRPGPRNALVADLYDRLGFQRDDDGWFLDLTATSPIDSPYIREQP